jgi:hypothetical protein
MACHFMSLFGSLNFFEIIGFLSDFSVLCRFFYFLSRLFWLAKVFKGPFQAFPSTFLLSWMTFQLFFRTFRLFLATFQLFSTTFQPFSTTFQLFCFLPSFPIQYLSQKNKGLRQFWQKPLLLHFMITIDVLRITL